MSTKLCASIMHWQRDNVVASAERHYVYKYVDDLVKLVFRACYWNSQHCNKLCTNNRTIISSDPTIDLDEHFRKFKH